MTQSFLLIARCRQGCWGLLLGHGDGLSYSGLRTFQRMDGFGPSELLQGAFELLKQS